MKILITIPHYYNPSTESGHGSSRNKPLQRINALSACLYNLQSLFGRSQYMINIFNKKAIPANINSSNDLDIVICTTDNKHLLKEAKLPKVFYRQHETSLEDPKYLGFECQKVLKENIGKYDYYCFMEDDLIINDPLFFQKIKWFSDDFMNLLQPNRYEVSTTGKVLKSYVDGDIRPAATQNYQNVNEFSEITKDFLGQDIVFKRPYNPHSGCFFLNQKQMEY